jgi:hypothetical protein
MRSKKASWPTTTRLTSYKTRSIRAAVSKWADGRDEGCQSEDSFCIQSAFFKEMFKD